LIKNLRFVFFSSYHLQWDKGTGGITWFDLSGLTSQNLDLEFIVHNSDVVGGQVYQFRIKAENAFGWAEL